MEFLEPLENPTHVAVGIIDRARRSLYGSQCVLSQLDYLAPVAFLQQYLD